MRIILASLILSIPLLISCSGGTNQNEQASAVIDVNTEEFAKLAESESVQLIDVRTAAEFADGHLANATNIDILEKDFMIRAKELDTKLPVLVYCRSGGRSSRAAGILKQMGFGKIYNLEGGITKWMSTGKPVE